MSILGREAKLEAVIMSILTQNDEKTRELPEVGQNEKIEFWRVPWSIRKTSLKRLVPHSFWTFRVGGYTEQVYPHWNGRLFRA